MDQDTKEKIEKLRKQQDVLKARIQLMENKEKAIARKIDTRMKILIGSYFLEQYQKKNKFDDIVKIMDSYLTRESDRKIFNLKANIINNIQYE
jgi:large subunit ribosomal protein L7/L12